MKQRFLAYIDYGTGGVFLWVVAESKQEIERRHPGLRLLDKAPAWMTAKDLGGLEATAPVYDLPADAEKLAYLLK